MGLKLGRKRAEIVNMRFQQDLCGIEANQGQQERNTMQKFQQDLCGIEASYIVSQKKLFVSFSRTSVGLKHWVAVLADLQ